MRKKILSVMVGVIAGLFGVVPMAFAQEAGAAAGGDSSMIAIGAALAIGIAAAGCALGQGRAAAAALEGIARNPSASGKIQTPMILGLAFIESIAIYAFLIAIFLQGKI